MLELPAEEPTYGLMQYALVKSSRRFEMFQSGEAAPSTKPRTLRHVRWNATLVLVLRLVPPGCDRRGASISRGRPAARHRAMPTSPAINSSSKLSAGSLSEAARNASRTCRARSMLGGDNFQPEVSTGARACCCRIWSNSTRSLAVISWSSARTTVGAASSASTRRARRASPTDSCTRAS